MENDTVKSTVESTVKKNYPFLDNNGKATNFYQANKEKIQKRCREFYGNLSEDEKIKTINQKQIVTLFSQSY